MCFRAGGKYLLDDRLTFIQITPIDFECLKVIFIPRHMNAM